MNLAHPIAHLIGRSIQSLNTGIAVYERTRIALDPADYDGLDSVTLRVVGHNVDTVDRDIRLVVVGGATKATITIPSGEGFSEGKFFESSPFTLDAGLTEYELEVDQSPSSGDVVVRSAQIWGVQTGATKTRLAFQLGFFYVNGTLNAAISQEGAGTFKFLGPSQAREFLKEESLLGATIGDWTLEITGRQDFAGDSGEARLHNITDGAAVTASLVDGFPGGGVWDRRSTNFSNGATNFDDLDEFEVEFRSTGEGIQNLRLGAARLYVKITDLEKASIHLPVASNVVSIANTATVGSHRPKFTSSEYSAIDDTIWEVNGILNSGTSFDVLLRIADDAEALTGSDVSGSGITVDQASPGSRQRVTGLTVSDGHLLARCVEDGTSSIDLITATVILNVSEDQIVGDITESASLGDFTDSFAYNFLSHSVPGDLI